MAVIEYKLEIDAPRDLVFRASQDYSVRYDWDPFPEHIKFVGDIHEVSAGARVLVIAKSGLRMEVEFVVVAPPERAAIVMTSGPVFLKTFGGTWMFRELGPQRTLAVFRYTLKTKWWAIPLIADSVSSWYFHRAVKARLQGLKAYCESVA